MLHCDTTDAEITLLKQGVTVAHQKTQAELARTEIERKLFFNELDVSALYSENKLASLLDLGRTPVREALQALEQDEMLAIHPRKGVQFLSITAEQQLQLLEVRKQIEPICLRFAAMRASTDQRREMLALGSLIVQSAKDEDEKSLLSNLQDIHRIVTEATNNPYFHHSLARVQSQSRRFWFANKDKSDNLLCSYHHEAIMRAVAMGNEDEAVKQSGLLLEHLTESAFKAPKPA
ncbi:DNA-binding transcriptional regulator, GntR family [Pseudovibrio ascidiaceicola]|uniref:DNA-binding transcriptional regulator, GntR family n=1 Tax=Pseudovibrio ascidiaceicola TaxID=285279 RepID=A0A1I4EGZ4_9HYPH|nr:Transcriptional regulator NanR [Pseudovibrio sp. Ad26]SFL05048.1 DNA-binding transcriptional regulator, GntR family [Pseudovibrio ascidiaceicola]